MIEGGGKGYLAPLATPLPSETYIFQNVKIINTLKIILGKIACLLMSNK